ncbi:four helix bundle protein [Altibacter lentus]|uniref:four helix bundle protein n=1 Tax=Altibacter lentus TaxID=1223410 RepID=UPI0005514200|nr:four helix bundle protein [Altibacter lentus]
MDHKEMNVWNKGMDLVERIYIISNEFPSEETYGLKNQIRRAAVSVPSNIAEGAARKGNKEFLQFINIALGSWSEVETQYLLAMRLGYSKEDKELDERIVSVRKLLLGTRNYIRKTNA